MKNNVKEKNLRQNKGITLIALIITIIVLLILAGVSIAMIAGENGILKRAGEASDKTGRANAIEIAQLDVIEKQSNNEGKIKDSEFKEILNKYFTDDEGNEITEIPNNLSELQLKTKDGKYDGIILASEIYNGSFGTENPPDTKETISKTESFVGYFADIEGDGTVDGIIYADLAVGNSKSGEWGEYDDGYVIPTIEENDLKDYCISKKNYVDERFDIEERDVLSPINPRDDIKQDRFYVMGLNDVGNDYCYWYYGNTSSITSEEFGTGKQNTITMTSEWNSNEHEERDKEDLWEIIQNESNKWKIIEDVEGKGWFVPSIAEWEAFIEELKINKQNYENKHLSSNYWSSTR